MKPIIQRRVNGKKKSADPAQVRVIVSTAAVQDSTRSNGSGGQALTHHDTGNVTNKPYSNVTGMAQ
jgi:hypothetical protein